MKNRLRKISESISEAKTGAVIIDHKNKKFIILDNTGWSILAEPVMKLAGALEGTGDGSIEVSTNADTAALLNDGYRESDNMQMIPVLESRIRFLNESYLDVMKDLIAAFNQAQELMKGSSIDDPKSIWLDLGVRIGVITEEDAMKLEKE